MNKVRRKNLATIIETLEAMKSSLEDVRDEEESAFDNLPESIQESERGETMQEIVDALYDACDSLEETIDSLNEII